LAERLASHVNKGTAIGKDIAKYGRQNFDVSVLDVCETKAKADKSERYWIAFYDTVSNGYNIMVGGTPSKKEMHMIAKLPKKPYQKHKKKKEKVAKTEWKPIRLSAKERKELERRRKMQTKYGSLPLDNEQIRVACLLGFTNGSLPC
jgi:hypothetical protein